MSDDELVGPGEPDEMGSGMRAKNLKNLPLILKPTHEGSREGTDGPYDYVACDVWVLDRAGIADHGTNVEFAWKRCLKGLRERIGKYVHCRPIEDGTSVVFQALDGSALEVARKALPEIKGHAATEAGYAADGDSF